MTHCYSPSLRHSIAFIRPTGRNSLSRSRTAQVKLDRGILAALGAAALFGLSTPIAKKLVGGDLPSSPGGTPILRFGVWGSASCSQRARLSWDERALFGPAGPTCCGLLGAIAFGGAIGPFLLMYGLQMTDSASASLILNLEGVFTALLAWFAFRENFDRRNCRRYGAHCRRGAWSLSMGSAFRAGRIVGPLAISGACLAWAIDNNLTRKVLDQRRHAGRLHQRIDRGANQRSAGPPTWRAPAGGQPDSSSGAPWLCGLRLKSHAVCFWRYEISVPHEPARTMRWHLLSVLPWQWPWVLR